MLRLLLRIFFALTIVVLAAAGLAFAAIGEALSELRRRRAAPRRRREDRDPLAQPQRLFLEENS